MKSKSKQEELFKQRAIVLQTLEFLMENYTGFFVLDDYDSSKEHYLQEKDQVEKYYKERRLDRITAKLANLTHYLYFKRDRTYQHYIKEKTGYQIDLYKNLRVKIDEVIQRGMIFSLEEFLDVEFMVQMFENDPNASCDKALLQSMLDSYQNAHRVYKYDNSETFDVSNLEPKDQYHSEEIKEKGLIYKVNSPNRRNWMSLHTSGKGEYALTYLVVGVDGGSGTVYCAKGKDLKIKADWEDDYTILIETLGKYEVLNCYRRITTRRSNISIQYVEKQ